jgi:S-adenosylmethionine:tRNA ribosyltransferase-isomerase
VTDFAQLLADYDYSFPESSVALVPASPRDAARLLVVDRDGSAVTDTTFAHLDECLPENAVVVFNETRVVPARLVLAKPTGGKVDVLLLDASLAAPGSLRALANRRLAVGSALMDGDRAVLEVVAHEESEYRFRALVPAEELRALLVRQGQVPLPPYLRHSPLDEGQRRTEYQAVFARHDGSVAAPTASLHFTESLLEKLRARGVEIRYVTLHVGLGTFAPLTPEKVASGRLHVERYDISSETADALAAAKAAGRPVIAVGTTVTRCLESAHDGAGAIRAGAGETDIFIHPGNPPRFVDGLVTNFHVPKSSLMMLVAAFVPRERLLAIYKEAVARGYRLFSFGDGMLVRPR